MIARISNDCATFKTGDAEANLLHAFLHNLKVIMYPKSNTHTVNDLIFMGVRFRGVICNCQYHFRGFTIS